MIKQPLVAALETPIDALDKTNPFDKLIMNDQLTYLPNLYLRQFKLVQDLIHLRQDFPEQKVLLPRNHTAWDHLLDQVKYRSKVVAENRKYQIAEKFHVARQARLELQRQLLRKQEQYHYHRILSSFLAESVLDHFHQQQTKMVEEPEQDRHVVDKPNPVKKNQDGIFVDDEGDDYPYIPDQNNLLDDLLNENIHENPVQIAQVQNLVQIQPISTYTQLKYSREKQEIDSEPQIAISRKACLRRINENVRKRLKIKGEEEEQPGRSLSSATVFLSNWLNLQPDPKSTTVVELPNDIEWLFSSERQRKKRDEESLELRWPPEQLQKMDRRNQKFNIRKGKTDNNILTLSISKEDDSYRELFSKNIASEKTFPPTLRNVEPLKVAQPKRYYNQFHDKDYEIFIMKYNKRKILKQFADKASLIFPQNYSHDELDQNESINTAKIFVHPPQKVLDRIIYKISDYKLTVSVRNQLKMPNLDLDRMILMAFLIKKYLSEFGNQWQSITQFISMSEYFSNIFVTQELVQQVYQLISKYEHEDNRLVELQLWDKKILPYDYYGSASYVQFNETMYSSDLDSTNDLKKMEAERDTSEQSQNIDLQHYQDALKEPVAAPKTQHSPVKDQFYAFSKNINKNVSKMQSKPDNRHKLQQHKKLRSILSKFAPNDKINPIDSDEQLGEQNDRIQINNQLSESLKGQIKIGSPFRKKKNINERNNQLVKILQALRNKNVSTSSTSVPKKPQEIAKPITQINAVNKPPIAPPMPAKQVQNQDPKKLVQKSPEKPDKKLGAPSKKEKDRKNKDQEDKK